MTGGFSCANCLHSRRYIVENKEGEEFEHFSCSAESIAIEDCIELQELPNGEGDSSKCARCRWGYTLTPDQTKCKIIQFPNCLQSTIKIENDREIEQCDICYKGYFILDGQCQKIESDIKIKNCSLYVRDPDDGEVTCFLCEDGYFESQKSKVCEKDSLRTKCVEGEQDPG